MIPIFDATVTHGSRQVEGQEKHIFKNNSPDSLANIVILTYVIENIKSAEILSNI